jgi:hypothetical protein
LRHDNYKNLVESIVEKYPPGYLEVADVQYYDANLEVKYDQEMAMFEKHSMSKIVEMFIVYCSMNPKILSAQLSYAIIC